MIGLSSYANQPLNGFGIDTAQNVSDLQKALSAGYQIPPSSGGSALRVESLEGSLKVTQFTANHIKFWKKISKSPAYSTVEEYNQLTAYGSSAGAFVQEGELPATQDSTYARKTALVKYLGTTREVTHPMTVVHPAHGDVIALETQNGILWLLERVEDNLFHADSNLAFDGESEEWDGLDAMIDSTSFVDLEGQPLQEADIEEAANQLVEQFAYPTDLWLGSRAASDLVKTMYPRERVNLPAPQNGQIGMAVNSMMTQAGQMELNPNVFLKRGPTPPSAATSSTAPVASTITAAVDTGTTLGDFNKGAASGTNAYAYTVTMCNRFGESAPSAAMGSSVDITQAQKDAFRAIDVTVTNGTVGTNVPEYIKVYRTSAMASGAAVPAVNSGKYSLIAKVAVASQANAGTTVYQDNNLILPFTEIAYMGEMTPAVLTFRQLLPMMKMDLAVLAPAYRFMILLYGTPLLFTPKKWTRLINIGRLA